MGKEGQVTGFLVRAASSDSKFIAELRHRIESTIPGVAATPARDHVQSDTQIRLAKAMSWTTAAVALILGSVGMLNTMLMSIFERTREIGILRAVGWRRSRVLALVLGEALVIALTGHGAGHGPGRRRACGRSRWPPPLAASSIPTCPRRCC